MSSSIEKDIISLNAVCYNNVNCSVVDMPSIVKDINVLVEFQYLLERIKNDNDNYNDKVKYKNLLLNSILYVRSISCGLGCSPLACKMMETYLYYSCDRTQNLYHFNDIAILLLRFVEYKNNSFVHGSWKDMIKLIDILYHSDILNKITARDMINRILETIVIPQMMKDNINMNNNHKISLCGKWLPRESSRLKWLARWIALKYYKIVHNIEIVNKKIAYKHYRKLCTSYNKYLKTPQIYMSARNWNKIVFERVSLGTFETFGPNFLNHNNLYEQHRIECKEKYINYLKSKSVSNKKYIINT